MLFRSFPRNYFFISSSSSFEAKSLLKWTSSYFPLNSGEPDRYVSNLSLNRGYLEGLNKRGTLAFLAFGISTFLSY